MIRIQKKRLVFKLLILFFCTIILFHFFEKKSKFQVPSPFIWFLSLEAMIFSEPSFPQRICDFIKKKSKISKHKFFFTGRIWNLKDFNHKFFWICDLNPFFSSSKGIEFVIDQFFPSGIWICDSIIFFSKYSDSWFEFFFFLWIRCQSWAKLNKN